MRTSFPRAHAGGGHHAVALVDALVHAEVHQGRSQGLSLAEVGGHAVGRGQRQLRAAHPEHLLVLVRLVAIEIPVRALWDHRVEAGLGGALQLPLLALKLHVHDIWPGPILLPHQGVHHADLPGQEGLVREVLRESHPHAHCQRQRAQQPAGVLVVVLQPPGHGNQAASFAKEPDLALSAAGLGLQDLAAGHVSGNGPEKLPVGVPRKLLGAILVDLVLGVVRGHHRRRLLEARLSQPGIFRPCTTRRREARSSSASSQPSTSLPCRYL